MLPSRRTCGGARSNPASSIERQRHFGDDECFADESLARVAGEAAAGFAHRLREVATGRVQRRRQSADDARASPRRPARRPGPACSARFRLRRESCLAARARGSPAVPRRRARCRARRRPARAAGSRSAAAVPGGRGWRRARRAPSSRAAARRRGRAAGSRRWRRRSAAAAPTAPSRIQMSRAIELGNVSLNGSRPTRHLSGNCVGSRRFRSSMIGVRSASACGGA